MNMTRRAAMAAAFATGAFAASPALARPRMFGPGGRPLGVNLYIVADMFRGDAEGTLRALKEIGYREVETDLSSLSAERLKTMLTRTGLSCSALSVLPTPLRGGPSLETAPGVLAEAVHKVGARYLTCTLFPLPPGVQMRPQPGENVEQMMARVSRSLSADHFRRTADLLNAKGEALRREGVKFAYHNHNPELAPFGETNGLSILLENTDPKLVSFEMDAGWVVAAGHDPAVLLKAYPRRFRLMHVKDIAPTHVQNTVVKADTTEVGSGVVNWPRVLRAAVASGVEHFAVEQEPPYSRMPPIEAARKAYGYLTALEV